jgi:two-component system, LytTR family, sensor kinase
MLLTPYYRRFLEHPSRYLPFLYPILMPILTLYSFKVPFQTFEDAFRYWLFTGFLQLLLLLVIRKVVYSTVYNKWIRWLIAAAICGAIILIYVFLEDNFFHFTARFSNPNKWVTVIRYLSNIFILITLLESIKSATERKNIILDNIALENENAKAQLNLLLQQINPHFLFNCFTVLQAMVRSKDVRTDAFIEKLSDVFQKTLETDRDTVTLKEELDFFNAYMYLMNLRQEKAIFTEVQVSEASLGYKLPAFSLQLLAENCIKHNIVSIAKPLYIRLYQKDPKTLTISNNYQPKPVRGESFGIGISNLKQRYGLEGIKEGVQIEQNETSYSTTIKLF